MTEWTEIEISIGDVKHLLEEHDVEVTSSDGWVPIVDFVDKGEWDEYVLNLRDGRKIRCNENHLFETLSGWKSASEIEKEGQTTYFVDENYTFELGTVKKTNARIPIVDIQVASAEHRYFTNGISSHNTGVGKSLTMCHFAAANLVRGLNVLYITMEMADKKISQRIDMNLMNVTTDELELMSKSTFDRKLEAIMEKTVGKIVVKEYPTTGAGSATFRALLGELKTKKNFVPDVIYVDYINICASSRIKMGSQVNSYTYIKAIAEELRGLAVEFDVPVITATQTTRGGYGNSDVEITDVSESFGLPATADLMFALYTDEELDSMNQVVVKQLKNRYEDPGKLRRFVLGIDKPHMRLYDADPNAQIGIMDGPEEPKKNGGGLPPGDKFKDLF